MNWIPSILAMLMLEEADEIQRDQTISKGFDSYTLFLIPSNEWMTENQTKAAEKLRILFQEFGEAIGCKHDAVYFIDRSNEKLEDDVNKSKDYCDRFDLDHINGPDLIYTEVHPDIAGKDDVMIIKFNNIHSKRVVNYIQQLSKSIRTGKVPKRTTKLNYIYEISRNIIVNNKEVFRGMILKSIPKVGQYK